MRYISFFLASKQIADQTKDVTRRFGWTFVNEGDVLQPVKMRMGLRRGEKVELIGNPIYVVSVRREPLIRMIDDEEYGRTECSREGFPDMSPAEFVQMLCRNNRNYYTAKNLVTRIEFRYPDSSDGVLGL